jgi:hypothetical protein
VQVWLSTGTVVAAEVGRVLEMVSFKGGGVDAVHHNAEDRKYDQTFIHTGK